MKRFTERVVHYVTLTVITVFSVWVMWLMSGRGDLTRVRQEALVRDLPPASAPKAPVALSPIAPETCDVVLTYAGKVEPWETYAVGFEEAGRVLELGVNSAGEPLDEGDRVEAGQVLARLDDRAYRARRAEAVARLEQAVSDLQRATRVRETNPGAVSDTEFQQFVTAEALARAQKEVADKSLDDAVLRAPVGASISRRLIKAGESVSPHQIVFELVENDRVLLNVHVPESQIRELEGRQRQVQENRQSSGLGIDPEDMVFRAHVRLEGTDPYGAPWPALQGQVYRIAEVADPRTSLFDVEIELDNSERLLRPGMVATASMVVRRMDGYRIPAECVIFRENQAHAFTVAGEPAPVEMLYWELGPTTIYRARRVELPRWIDQGAHVVAPREDVDLQWIVTRGQHRLADGQLVRPVGAAAEQLSGERVAAEIAAARAERSPGDERTGP